MKLNNKLSEQISKQITAEYHSAYLYLSMSAYCSKLGFQGFANWMHVQAQEELAHGTHMFEYILQRGELPQLSEIPSPVRDYNGLSDVFEQALAHEKHITELIHSIASSAMQEGDHAAYAFIQWYVTEQVEEEASADAVLQKLNQIGHNPSMLYALDAEMAARVFIDPFAQ